MKATGSPDYKLAPVCVVPTNLYLNVLLAHRSLGLRTEKRASPVPPVHLSYVNSLRPH